MSQYKLSFIDDSVISLLESVEQYYQYVKEIKFDLPIPTCISNEHCLTMNVLEKKWFSDFPTLYYVCNELEKDNYMFSVPFEEYHYLYYHMLVHVRDYKKKKLKFASLFVFYLTLILRTICLRGKKMLLFFLRDTYVLIGRLCLKFRKLMF